MRGFDLAQFAHERVELGVAHLGIVEDEVPLGVVVDQLTELLHARIHLVVRRRGLLRRLRRLRRLRGHAARLTTGSDAQAPTASFVAAAWSCTRSPSSRA